MTQRLKNIAKKMLLVGVILGLSGCFATSLQTAEVQPVSEIGAIRYVAAQALNVRACPDTSCEILVRFYQGDRVEVFETQDGWSRLSPYYDASIEGLESEDGQGKTVARWVSSDYLLKFRHRTVSPPKKEASKALILNTSMVEKIRGLPKVGENGFTSEDENHLIDYSIEMITSDQCTSIERAGKNPTNDGTYFVHCADEDQHRFFTPKKTE